MILMGFNILSTFSGMEISREIFNELDLNVDQWFSSEVDTYSLAVSKYHYSDVIHLGDIKKIMPNELPRIDIIVGGSPCQGFSFAGKQKGMTTKEKLEITTLEQYLHLKDINFEFDGQSYLFWEYIRLLKELKPKYFLLENVLMNKKWEHIITTQLGVEPIMINSSLVSAQDRKRLYWTNIPNIQPPTDKEIYIDDILEDIEHKILPKYRQEYTNYNIRNVDKSIYKSTAIQLGSSKQFGCSVRSNGKAFTLRATECNGIILENMDIRQYTVIECERLQTLKDNYTKYGLFDDGDIKVISNTQRKKMIGNGWTKSVIAHILSFITS